jgi:aldehyde dehydrogenase (NAD+)
MTTLLALCAGLRIGEPAEEPFMGPMLSADRLARFVRLRDQAQQEGAEVVLRGERLAWPGHFILPSIHLIHQRKPAGPYQQEELFGPDLAVYPVRDFDEGLSVCDDTRYGLCAALFSESPLRWKRFAEEVHAGALFWNRGTVAPSGLLPFGGTKYSGVGGRGGADAIVPLLREVSLLGRTSQAIDPLPGTLEGLGDEESNDSNDNDEARTL